MGMRTAYVRGMMGWNVWRGTIRRRLGRVMHRDTRVRLRGCRVRVVRLCIWCWWQLVCPGIRSSAVVFAMAKVTTSRLGGIWHDLHATRYNTCRTSTSCCVGRSSWTAEAFVELLK